ncbi:MAG TPA: ATP-binding protein, partial [Candidatus Acidoferrum sp.]|nr:ATP-binding protein [Candidatus Acidoferrum sp.]
EAAAAMSPHSHEIVQLMREALSNVVRHAGASHARVRLERAGSFAVLTVEDDGVGFSTRSVSAGNGLRNMRERVVALGGGLKLSSRKGKGTLLRFTIPL